MSANLTNQVRASSSVTPSPTQPAQKLTVEARRGRRARETINTSPHARTFAEQVTNVARDVGVEAARGQPTCRRAGTWKDLTARQPAGANLTRRSRDRRVPRRHQGD